MISPKAALLRIFEADAKTSSSISFWVSLITDFLNPKWCIVASTMITAPSTISPKSIAPKLIKLALTPKIFINPKANNKDKGIAEATIKPALKLPRNRIKTKITINAPSIKFVSTVLIARFTRSVLSKNGSIMTSSGSEF